MTEPSLRLSCRISLIAQEEFLVLTLYKYKYNVGPIKRLFPISINLFEELNFKF